MPSSIQHDADSPTMAADRSTMAKHPLYKTEWCDFVSRSHGCYHGANCRYAHSWIDYKGSHKSWCAKNDERPTPPLASTYRRIPKGLRRDSMIYGDVRCAADRVPYVPGGAAPAYACDTTAVLHQSYRWSTDGALIAMSQWITPSVGAADTFA